MTSKTTDDNICLTKKIKLKGVLKMGAPNFYNHENGIFIVEGYTYEGVKEHFVECEGLSEDEINDEMIYNAMNDCNDDYYRDFMNCILTEDLEKKGYNIGLGKNWSELTVYNSKGKWVADLELRSGRYDGVQLIVETDMYEKFDGYFDTKDELLKQATPHHKNLLKVIANHTTPITCVGVFSNGEAVYELVK